GGVVANGGGTGIVGIVGGGDVVAVAIVNGLATLQPQELSITQRNRADNAACGDVGVLLKSDERAIGEARPGSDAGNSPGERHAGSDQPASEALAMGVAVRVHTVHAIADVQMPESAAQQKPVADAAA